MANMMNKMMGGWWGFAPMWPGYLLNLLVVGLLIVALVVVGRYLTSRPAGYPDDRGWARALEILKERYARGEIGKEEFEAKRRDLS